MLSHVPLSKPKFFTRVVRVALVSHLCCSYLTRAAFVLLVSPSCCSCHTRFARVWLSFYEIDQVVQLSNITKTVFVLSPLKLCLCTQVSLLKEKAPLKERTV